MNASRVVICGILAFGVLGIAMNGYGAEEFRPQQVIPRPFPAITKFPVASAEEAAGKIGDTELVLGVVVGEEARAYPINMLTGPQREILNDTLGGRAIAATW